MPNKMIKQYIEIYDAHRCFAKICVCGLQTITLLSSALIAGCAVVPDSNTPKLDQEFGKSVQSSKDTQRVPVDPNKAQTVGGPTSREARVYVDNYIRGAMTSGTVLEAPITSGK